VSFVWKACPEILAMVAASKPVEHLTLKNVLAGLLVVTAKISAQPISRSIFASIPIMDSI
jgi:hypothetical protein